MNTKVLSLFPLLCPAACAVFFFALPNSTHAYPIYGDPPPCATCANNRPKQARGGVSLTEGNLNEPLMVATTGPAFGGLPNLGLSYNSYNADGTRANVDTTVGYGWTHSYNIFLFSQRGHMFRYDESGRVTKYKLGAGGTFTAAPGYFETLVKNPDGTFTLGQKDGTRYKFASVPGTPFLVGGPVYPVASITDRNGNVTTFAYAGGLLATVTDTYGRSVRLTYNSQNKVATFIDPIGRVTTLAYDGTGHQLTTVTDPLGQSTHYSYNILNQLTSKVDRDGRTFAYLYDTGKPTGKQDGVGASFLGLGNPNNWGVNEEVSSPDLTRNYLPTTTTETDGRGNLWKYDYNANGYLTQEVAPDGAVTLYTYDPVTLMVSTQTDANNHTTSYQYDAQGNRIQVIDALGNVTISTYEPHFSMMTSTTDPKGRVTTYDYDTRGNCIKETDPLLQTRTWTYDGHGNILTETDKRGDTTTYTYDANGNRASVTAPPPLSYLTRMTYDAVGNLLTRTDPNLHTITFAYDNLNRVTRLTDATGKTSQAFYDHEGNRVQTIDRNDHSTFFQYDQRERLIGITDALGQAATSSYDGNDNLTTAVDRNHHTTTLTYDVRNRVIGTTDAELNPTQSTYDPVGNMLTQIDANGHVTAYGYDALNRRTEVTDAENYVTTYHYDTGGDGSGCTTCGATPGTGIITQQTDGNGKVTYFKYDDLDRLTAVVRKEGDTADVIDASDAVTSFTYDPENNRISLTEPNGNASLFEYDVLNRATKETNAAGDVARFSYDGAGNLLTTTSPNGNVTTTTYDALDRVQQVDDSAGRVMSYSYDPTGNLLSETDGNNNSTDYSYDAVDRCILVTDALAQASAVQYDAVGNVVKTTDREGRTTTATYDKINRRTSTTDPLPATTQSQYDGVGNLVGLTDANSHTTQYAYDGLNRLVQETYPNAAPNMRSFTYDAVNLTSRTDQKGQTTTYTYNDLYFMLRRGYPVSPADNLTYDLSGRLLSAERGGWVVAFTYDGGNRVTQTTQNGKTVSYSYDIPGRTRTVVYPGGRTITETTDARGRLAQIGETGSPASMVNYTYDLGDRVVSRADRNGVVANYGYNANSWITGLDHTNGAVRVAGFGHDYDPEGIKRFEEKLTDAAGSQTRSEAYQYDSNYRLIDYKVGALVGSTVPVPATQTQYSLDPVGNWNVKTKDAIPETRSHSVTNEITQIDAVAVISDPNGNTSEDALYRYAYDEENRLTAVTRKSDSRLVGQYQYDALSGRVRKIADPAAGSSPVETRYFYDAARIVEEQDSGGSTQATYVYGNYIDEVITMDRGGQALYYHPNTLWSAAAITDGAGSPVERYTYDGYGSPTIYDGAGAVAGANPWGTPHSAISNPWLFTGRQFDEETGLYFYRARDYDPVKGRFLQRDPAGYVDGMNLYEYGLSQPPTNLDPMGLDITVAGKAVDSNSDRYKGWLKNPVYKEILEKLSTSKRPAPYTVFASMDDLELELRLRAAFIKCMTGLGDSGCGFGKPLGTSAQGWRGLDYTGPGPSAALNRFLAKKDNGKDTSTIGCHQAGFICAWVALRDAMEAQEAGSFDKRFAGKTISIDRMSRIPLDFDPRKVMQRQIGENIPGDFIYFRNIADYPKTRRNSTDDDPVHSAFGTENAVFIGNEKWCGFPFREPFTAQKIRKYMLDDYNAGHQDAKLGMPLEYTPKNMETAIPIQELRLPNRNYMPPAVNPRN